MRLIIKEYLSLLKESGELDKLLPDLLLCMGIVPLSEAEVGVRQYGVDISAVDAKNKILYLFTVKQGDIDRKTWDSGNIQDVRASLNEINDVYLRSKIPNKYSNFKKLIVLSTGGELKQQVESNWNGYVESNTKKDEVEYEFWGGDKLALFIENYMFSENLLPKEFRSLFRRTLSLIGDIDYKLEDYSIILNNLLFETEYSDTTKQSVKKKIKKNLRTINLCLSVIWFWSKKENNIRNSLYAGEKTVLLMWDFLSKNKLLNSPSVIGIFNSTQVIAYSIYEEYVNKIKAHCAVENGLSCRSGNYLLETINIYEQLGIISTFGIIMHKWSYCNADFNEMNIDCCRQLCMLIKNHQSAKTPLYDSHSIEISLAIYYLAINQQIEFVNSWIIDIITNIRFAFNVLGKYFPISSDSFEELVGLNVIREKDKNDYIEISTLLPMLAQWCCAINLPETYQMIKQITSDSFAKTTMQIWYPDNETNSYIYNRNAARQSGAMDAPIKFLESIEDMKQQIQKVQKNTISINELSCCEKGYYELSFISNRHYKTPFLPQFIQLTILNEGKK
jgi:hypothetical protein